MCKHQYLFDVRPWYIECFCYYLHCFAAVCTEPNIAHVISILCQVIAIFVLYYASSYFAVFISYQSNSLLTDCLNIFSSFDISVCKADTQMPSSSFIARFEVLTVIFCRLRSSLIDVQETFIVSSTLFIMPGSSLIEIALHSSHADHMLQDLNCLHLSSMNWTNQITEVEVKELCSLTSL